MPFQCKRNSNLLILWSNSASPTVPGPIVNEVQYTIAAAVIIPSIVAAGVFVMPSNEERQERRIEAHLEDLRNKKASKEKKVAGLFSDGKDEQTHLVVLQPFVMMGGVFSVHLEATGDGSRNALCTNLPIVHDAVLTELHNSSEDPEMLPPGKHLKQYADLVRQQVNDAFGQTVVSTVILAYADMNTSNANYKRMQTGSSKRCVKSKM